MSHTCTHLCVTPAGSRLSFRNFEAKCGESAKGYMHLCLSNMTKWLAMFFTANQSIDTVI